jgi:hypothetical protein
MTTTSEDVTAASNGSAPDIELTIEQKVDILIWLHAELAQRFTATAGVVSGMLAQQMQPQVQQAILQRLMG